VYCGALPSTEDCLLAFYLEANEIWNVSSSTPLAMKATLLPCHVMSCPVRWI
jgi:hypothetical protein